MRSVDNAVNTYVEQLNNVYQINKSEAMELAFSMLTAGAWLLAQFAVALGDTDARKQQLKDIIDMTFDQVVRRGLELEP